MRYDFDVIFLAGEFDQQFHGIRKMRGIFRKGCPSGSHFFLLKFSAPFLQDLHALGGALIEEHRNVVGRRPESESRSEFGIELRGVSKVVSFLTEEHYLHPFLRRFEEHAIECKFHEVRLVDHFEKFQSLFRSRLAPAALFGISRIMEQHIMIAQRDLHRWQPDDLSQRIRGGFLIG